MTACLLGAVFVFLFSPMPVTATGERLMFRQYTVEILVDCIDEAVAILRELPGVDVRADITGFEGSRQAFFSRRVEAWAFNHVQAVLRELGEVVLENEHARHLRADILFLDTRIRVLTEEMNRLMLLMAGSDSLWVLMAVDNQLSHVSRERDRLMGQRNRLTNDAETALVQIWLSEDIEVLRPTPPGFGQRMADAFTGTWAALLRGGGHLLVFLARVGIPLVIWVVVLGAPGMLVWRKLWKIKWRPRLQSFILSATAEDIEDTETHEGVENHE